MKRLLALVLSICLTLSCLPVNAIALEAEPETEVVTEPVTEVTEAPAQEETLPAQVEETAPALQADHTAHGACICAISGAACSHEQLDWKEWPYTDKLPTDAGNYYLTGDGDVTIKSTHDFRANVVICLNGRNINLNGKHLNVFSDTLTVMNCKTVLDAQGRHSTTGTEGGKIYGGSGSTGGAIAAYTTEGVVGTVKAYGIEFNGNTATTTSNGQGGGGVYASGVANIYACRFTNNSAATYGGAIAVYLNGVATVDDCVITGNTAKHGGALSVYSGSSSVSSPSITVTGDTQITENSATSNGGAIYTWRLGATPAALTAKLLLKDNTVISGNHSDAVGGGVYMNAKGSTVEVFGNVQITGNTAKTKAPNVYLWDLTHKLVVSDLGSNASIGVFTGDNFKDAKTEPDTYIQAVTGKEPGTQTLTGIFLERDGVKQIAYNAQDGFYYPDHTHQACICAITGDECSSHGKSAVWTAWESKDSLPTEAGNYYLTDKVTLAATATINANVKICLNGFDIDLNKKSIVLNGAGDLTLLNCKATLKTNGQLDENKAKITGGNAIRGGAISVAKGGKLTAIGVEFYKNVQQRDTQASGQGGGAIHSEGTTTLKACRFIENSSNNCGGAVSAYVHATLNVDDCYFSGNSAVTGGALSAYTDSNTRVNVVVTITGDTEFVGNTATSNGGAIFNWRASSTLEDYALKLIIKDNTKISGNHSEAVGGGIYMNNKGTTIEISGNVNITGNTAKTKAPNVYLWDKNTHKLVLSGLGAGASIGIFTGDNFTAADPDEFLTLASGATLADTENTGIFWDRSDPAKVIGYNATEKFYFVKDPLPPHKHGACSCGIIGATCSHTELNWQPWESTDSLPTDEGSYYLLDDVKLTGTVTIAENVNLCLNGHNINLNSKKIHNDGNLTIMNCQATVNEKNQLTSTTGKIYGGLGSSFSAHIYGGAISTNGDMNLIGVWFADNLAKGADARTGGALYVEDGMTTITSCKFSGNQALSDTSTTKNKGVGGAISVYINGSLDITDSLFENNTADLYGGAICVNNRNATKDTSVTIDGNSVFTGNKTNSTTDGYGSALYLYCREESADTLSVTIGGNTQITGNTAGKYGAVCLRTKAAANPLNITVSGNVNISGNTASDANRANLYFFDSGYTMQVGQLGANAKLFVSTPSEVGDPDTFLQLAQNVTLADTQDTHIVYDRAEPDAVVAYNTNSSVKFYFAGEYDLNHNGHGVCLCTANGSQCAHEQVVWQPWMSKTSLPSTAGNWYLTCDVTLSAKADITGKVNLCLNGYSVDLNKKYINLTGGDDLTILNCEAVLSSNGQLAEGNAKITNGKHTHGAAAVVAIGAKMTAMGVEFSKNVNERTDGNLYEGQGGGAIQSEGELNLYACRFIENSTNNNGGAITVYKGTALIDDCYFSGNTAARAGGALSVYTGSSNTESTIATITGSTEFVGNSCGTNGGAIIVNRHKSNTNTAVTAKVILDGDIKITGNTAKNHDEIADSGIGGGVYLHYAYAVAEIHGNVQITGNTAERRGSNLYLWDTTQRILVGELGQDASIGVATGSNFPGVDPDEYLSVADGVTLSNTDKTGIYVEKDGTVKDVAYSSHPVLKFYFAGESYDLDHDDHGVCLCAVSGDQCSHEQPNWQPWISGNSLPNAAGNYYLTCDVKLNAKADISGKVNLCLNGYSIDLNEKYISVTNGDDLTILNCEAALKNNGQLDETKAVGGKIYNGKHTHGGAVVVAIGGKFAAYGVEFSDNNNYRENPPIGQGGGAVYTEGDAKLYACRFVNNQSNNYGGAVALYANGSVEIDDCYFSDNSANFGGALSVYSGSGSKNSPVATVTGNTEMVENTSTSSGGAIVIYRHENTPADYQPQLILQDNTRIAGNAAAVNGGAVSLKGGQLTMNGTVIAENQTGASAVGGAICAEAGKIVANGVTIEKNEAKFGGGAVYIKNAEMEFTGGAIRENVTVGGGGGGIMATTDSKVKLTDTVVSSNVAPNGSDGGGIRLWENAAVELVNTKITENAAGSGAGISVFRGSKLTVTGGEISKNIGANNGGAIYADTLSTADVTYNTVTVDISGTVISDNEAANRGGAIYMKDIQLTMNDVQLSGNKTEASGGAICADTGKIVANGVAVEKNQAKSGAGGIYIKNAEMEFTGGTISENITLGGGGGGIMATVDAKVKITDSVISSNSAPENNDGGGIRLWEKATVELVNTEISKNTAGSGAGISVFRGSKLTVTGGEIAENAAENNGGGIYSSTLSTADAPYDAVQIVLNGVTVTENESTNNGGGIWAKDTKITILGDTFVDDNEGGKGNNLYLANLSYKLQVGKIGETVQIGVSVSESITVGDPDIFMKKKANAELTAMENTGLRYESGETQLSIGYSKNASELFYFSVAADEGHTSHNICQCYLNGKECDHVELNWKPWPYTDRLPTTTGYWYLIDDVKVADIAGGSTGVFEIASGEKVRLCLNGHNVTFNKDNTEKSNYYIKDGGDLAIINCQAVLNEQGKLDIQKSKGGQLTGGNTVRTVEDGVYSGGKAGAIYSLGTLRLVGVHLTGNSADNLTATGQGGGALYVERGTAEVLYCALTENKTTGYGGAIALYRNGKLTVENTILSGNEARHGGAISVYANVDTMQDEQVLKVQANTVITKNTATYNGGGIYVERHSNAAEGVVPVLSVTKATISDNTCADRGGAISIVNPSDQIRIAMKETVVSGNTSKAGGGIYMERTKLVATTVTVSDNTAKGNGSSGGGIYGMGAVITLQTNTLVTGNKTEKGGGGGIYVSGASTVNLYGCTVSKNESPDGGGVRLWRESVLNMYGGKIIENHSTAGGGGLSMVKGSILNLESGQISDNTCVKNGAGIYADNYFQTTDPEYDLPQLNLKGGRISGNTAAGSYGGGIYAKNCKTELSGTKITGNKAEKGNGAGIYASKVDVEVEDVVYKFDPTFKMTGGEVSGNKAKNAGGIYFNDVDATISGGVIKNNTASENAGGISVRTAKLTLKGDALISGNKGKSGGGIIVQVQSELDMQGGIIEKNSAKNGGGILLWSRSVVNIKGGNIRSNKATKGNGGGIYAQGGAQVNLKGGRVSYNNAESKGGGIYCTVTDGYTTRFTVSGGTIIGNTAVHGGGAYTNKGAVTNTYGGYWTENESEVCGGAIYVDASPANFYGGTFIKNHALDCGGAINGKKAEILLDGAIITENISDARGGGLRIYNDCVFTMKSGEVTKNQAARAGGGIGFQNCTAYIEGGEIVGNKVTGSELYPNPIGGGGINIAEGTNVYSQQDTLVEISGGKIADNYSPTDGGGIFLSGRTVMNITGGEIINNTAKGNGGAVMSHPRHTNSRTARATLNVTGGKISGNTATDGGALYICYTGELNLDGATINGNTASGIGGAVYLGRGTKASMKDSLLTENKAAQGSGFYAIDDLTMHNLEVTKNDSGSGYAVYIDRGEFDGRSYVLSLIKISGDIRICDNHGDKADMFIGKDAKINVAKEGLGKNTLINVDLEYGVLTNTIIGAYNYEGGNLKYVVTYGDRSMTDLEPIPVEQTQPDEDQPATEPAVEQVENGTFSIAPVVLGVAVLAVVAAIVLILLMKRKKNGKKN